MNNTMTARSLGLALCHDCHLLVEWPQLVDNQKAFCPRCRARIYQRKPDSLKRTWALVIASLLLYLPANLLPMTYTRSLGGVQTDTIMSGVVHFIKTGSFGVALIIFVASICVPLLKLLILTCLLLSIEFRLQWRLKDRTRLFRIIAAIGRWSMLDIYVVTIVVALVKLGSLMSIDAGPAAFYFAAVVVLTMLAAKSFDPRLMWDVVEEGYESERL